MGAALDVSRIPSGAFPCLEVNSMPTTPLHSRITHSLIKVREYRCCVHDQECDCLTLEAMWQQDLDRLLEQLNPQEWP